MLEGVNLELVQGQIVGLLGRSGSGKSTLLRLIAGLSRPNAGELTYLGEPIAGPAPGIAMVFQSFALFPWLTVFENVALGLEAQRLPKAEIRSRTLAAIDLIGLDGFESAYPRELSGGMRQRVGFARALVVHPNILLMDEPFSALDVLTAETLRTDFLDLWSEGRMPIKGVILVTHNIEEAVLMCDRILVFGSNPGRVADRDQRDVAAAAQSPGSEFSRARRTHLCRDDGATGGGRAGRAPRVVPGAWHRHDPAARFVEFVVRSDGGAGGRTLQRQGRPA